MLRLRLLLDFVAIGLLIACLAYWWLGNLAHEVIGTALFALILLHNVFNRRWYGTVTKGRRDLHRVINITAILCFAGAMLVMLVTSLLISRDLFAFMALDGAFSVRAIHTFTAYWAMLFLAVHLGTRWTTVMHICRYTLGITGQRAWRTWTLRALAAGIALNGALVSSEMGFGTKLMLRYSLDMWDFNAETPRFFVNWLSMIGLYAALTHYALAWLQARRRRTRPAITTEDKA